MHVDARSLVSEYQANTVAADAKYEGEIITVNGVIEDIGVDILDKPFVVLTGTGPLNNVQCMFDKSKSSELARLRDGKSVTLKGKVSGKLGNVLLQDCSI